jgi:hypothetical protein
VVAFHKLIGLLILAVLMVIGTELLRRQAAAEFPDATFGGLGDRVRTSVPGRAARSPTPETKIDEIERLSELKEKGALTEQEFESAKAEVLGRG